MIVCFLNNKFLLDYTDSLVRYNYKFFVSCSSYFDGQTDEKLSLLSSQVDRYKQAWLYMGA